MNGELEPTPDRRRLNRSLRWQHPGPGHYSTSDAMRAVKKVGARKWQEGVRQPYHVEGQYQYTDQTFRRLRDAQAALETAETTDPRAERMRTPFHDRRGL
jgi:hypothetical protein